MLFTDASKSNNVHDRFSRSAPDDSRVKMLHLSNGVPAMKFIKDYPNINESLSPVSDKCQATAGFEVQEYGMGWKDIRSFLDGEDVDIRYVFRGLFVDRSESDCYRIDEVKPVVYQVYDAYKGFCDSTYAEGRLPKIEELCAAYKWNSISAAHANAQNTSIFESISQVIKDPQMNPETRHKVIYTIYISTARL